MAKGKNTTVFYCQNCGFESSKWMGQCPGCKEWNTFVEEVVRTTSLKNPGKSGGSQGKAIPTALAEVTIREEDKIKTGISELDRVLGGGIVQGSLTLVGGDPGIGKSTLLLQTCRLLANGGNKVLYISGEESQVQIKMRADRIGQFHKDMLLLCETNLDDIAEVIRRENPKVVVIDSIQTMYNENVSAAPGSVSQVRESTGALLQLAKGLNVAVFIVGHVTKEGTVAGPRVLEHMVDTVLYFEGDRHASYRILRGVKNRFGSTNEIGVFEMREEGLVDYEKGYLTAAIETQMRIYGSYFLPQVITKDFIRKMNQCYEELGLTNLRLEKDSCIITAAKQITHMERTLLLDILSENHKVSLYGPDKPEGLPNVCWQGSAGYFDEMPKVFKSSKINLNVSLKCIESGIPLRALDIMGSGGFLLTNYQPEIAEYFVDGEEVVMYTSLEDAVAKCEYYLEHEDERKEIGKRGYEKVRQQFGYEDRIRKMLEIAGIE